MSISLRTEIFRFPTVPILPSDRAIKLPRIYDPFLRQDTHKNVLYM